MVVLSQQRESVAAGRKVESCTNLLAASSCAPANSSAAFNTLSLSLRSQLSHILVTMTNVVKAVQGYIDRMVRSTAVTGMKVLLMDKETVRVLAVSRTTVVTSTATTHATVAVLVLAGVQKGIVGLAYTMSQILEREVYLVETIDATHDPMMHLKVCHACVTCVCLCAACSSVSAHTRAFLYVTPGSVFLAPNGTQHCVASGGAEATQVL